MISETDIQIGDWLHLEYTNSIQGFVSFNFKVSQLRRDYGDELLVWGEKTPDGKHFGNMGGVSKIQPIPLTAEILEKNGFVYNDIPFVQGWEQFGLTLTHGGDGFRITCGQNVAMIIDSVHELQHALRLCQIEKEIEL